MQKKSFEISAEPPGAIILLRRKSVLYWRDFGVKTALPNCVDEKAFSDLHEGKDAQAVIIEKMQ